MEYQPQPMHNLCFIVHSRAIAVALFGLLDLAAFIVSYEKVYSCAKTDPKQ